MENRFWKHSAISFFIRFCLLITHKHSYTAATYISADFVKSFICLLFFLVQSWVIPHENFISSLKTFFFSQYKSLYHFDFENGTGYNDFKISKMLAIYAQHLDQSTNFARVVNLIFGLSLAPADARLIKCKKCQTIDWFLNEIYLSYVLGFWIDDSVRPSVDHITNGHSTGDMNTNNWNRPFKCHFYMRSFLNTKTFYSQYAMNIYLQVNESKIVEPFLLAVDYHFQKIINFYTFPLRLLFFFPSYSLRFDNAHVSRFI